MPQFMPAGGGGASASSVDVQSFTSNGTWTKPSDKVTCQILIIDGGSGGTGGGYDSGDLPGGKGDRGRCRLFQMPICTLPDSISVTIGAGGAGGAGAVDNNVSGGDGGGESSFGDLKTDKVTQTDGDAIYKIAPYGYYIPQGGDGGDGGNIDSAGSDGIGSQALFYDVGPTAFYYTNHGAGGAAGTAGANGGDMTQWQGGGGGGGGGATSAPSAPGGNGGNGGSYGAGGGGGGSGNGTAKGGDGGDGAGGLVVVWSW